jgi:hypothetical protein
MTQYTDEPLVSHDVSMRRAEQDKLKPDQQKQIDNRRVDAPSSAFHQSVSATTGTKMRDLLSQVRKSSVTLPDELTMRNGTFIYTNK